MINVIKSVPSHSHKCVIRFLLGDRTPFFFVLVRIATLSKISTFWLFFSYWRALQSSYIIFALLWQLSVDSSFSHATIGRLCTMPACYYITTFKSLPSTSNMPNSQIKYVHINRLQLSQWEHGLCGDDPRIHQNENTSLTLYVWNLHKNSGSHKPKKKVSRLN